MYEKFEMILSIMFIILGLFMVFMPKQSTKKTLRDSEEAVKKTRRNGYIVIGCGIILLIIDFVL